MEERMERERKVWNEHKDLSIAGERAKFEEEKIRLLKDLQDQLKVEQERCQRLEQKLYDAQMVCSIFKGNIFFFLCSSL
jgi:exonuclease VII large subunit